jgi:SAM-dependent methyltransferase
MNTDDMTISEALTALHEGTDRQGPGDDAFSLGLLRRLPELPSNCAIADLGCGTGVASVLLAQHFRQPVLCVDTSEVFLRALSRKAESLGIAHLIKTLCADMGSLDPAKHRFDLLWSEGAAYNLTFVGAMRQWRPLMAEHGIAVVSEMSWFGAERPREALAYWSDAYPEMADEQVNTASAERHGFELLFTERLPANAWWTNYYDPLVAQLDAHGVSPSKTMQEAISETRQEIALFRKFSDYFGYTFYVLRAA